MKVLVLYRPNSEHATAVESFLRDLEHRHELDSEPETLSLDSREGAATASLYDIVQYPAILVLDNFGGIVHSWQGEQMPLIDDVVGYSR